MIYDKLTNIAQYLGLHANLDIAIRYITTHDLTLLPLGRTELAGDQVYINVMEATAAPLEQQRFEIHQNYMDIQIDLIGTELIEIGDSSNMELDAYNPETDFAFASCPALSSSTIGPGNFILCMANEPHKPGIAASADTALKKCVFKVHR